MLAASIVLIGNVTTIRGLKQARALLHVRQTILINFRFLYDPQTFTPGLDLMLSASINSVLVLPYFRSTVRGNLVAIALTTTRHYLSAEQARGSPDNDQSRVTVRIQPAKCTIPTRGRVYRHSFKTGNRAKYFRATPLFVPLKQVIFSVMSSQAKGTIIQGLPSVYMYNYMNTIDRRLIICPATCETLACSTKRLMTQCQSLKDELHGFRPRLGDHFLVTWPSG